MANATTVSVTILDKEFQVSCEPDEVNALTASAHHLDEQMQTIRDAGKVVGLDRIAVMAALNIANEFLLAEGSKGDASERVSELTAKVTKALAEQQKSDSKSSR
ncbi:MAG: cell division protein ZapA [Gammaproteobacteria bacterium]|nr:cell division protein ZapA [Gammaproteobacteria bacterium]